MSIIEDYVPEPKRDAADELADACCQLNAVAQSLEGLRDRICGPKSEGEYPNDVAEAQGYALSIRCLADHVRRVSDRMDGLINEIEQAL